MTDIDNSAGRSPKNTASASPAPRRPSGAYQAQRRSGRPSGRPPLLVLAGLVFAVLVVGAALLDARRCARQPPAPGLGMAGDLQRLAEETGHARFRDPRGFFSIDAPHGWSVMAWPQTRDFNVRFRSPHGPMLTITAVPVDYSDFARLLRNIEELQERLGFEMHIEPTTFQDRPAIRRRTRLHHDTVFNLDFLHGKTAHNLQISIPHELVDAYADLLWQWLERYEVLDGDSPAENR